MQKIFIILSVLFFFVIYLTSAQKSKFARQPNNNLNSVVQDYKGLVGAWYHGEDLTRIGSAWKLDSLNIVWDAITGRGNSWSAQWEGYIIAPESGEITFHVETNREVILKIDNNKILHLGAGSVKNVGTVSMIKDKRYHLRLFYLQNTGGSTYFKILWSWRGQSKHIIFPNYLTFDSTQAEWWNYIEHPDPSTFNFTTLKTVPQNNYFAYNAPGRFAGWPANNGAWAWGNELLVSYTLGYLKTDFSGGHAIREDMPSSTVLSRSLDGGKTWNLESNEDFSKRIITSPGVNFAHPDFAMKVINDQFYISYNRGKSWNGAYRILIRSNGAKLGNLTSRTDYKVLGNNECLVYMSTETGLVESNYQDRAFCALTTDGGKTFDFLGWMTQDTEIRSVMPSTVRIDQNHLVSVVRRKHEESFGERPSIVKNWIEAEESLNNGKTWTTLGKVAETDLGERNGNPPAMVKLSDGRLCVAYGYRDFPYGIRMKVSSNSGKTWGDEIVIRSDGATWDLGYPRMLVNADGKIVIMYYFTTTANPSQHIGVTIIDPDDLEKTTTGFKNIEKRNINGISSLNIYPNPVIQTLNIGFEIIDHRSAKTSVKIYDMAGNIVKPLIDNIISDGKYNLKLETSVLKSGYSCLVFKEVIQMFLASLYLFKIISII
jgi:hypothetical protein